MITSVRFKYFVSVCRQSYYIILIQYTPVTFSSSIPGIYVKACNDDTIAQVLTYGGGLKSGSCKFLLRYLQLMPFLVSQPRQFAIVTLPLLIFCSNSFSDVSSPTSEWPAAFSFLSWGPIPYLFRPSIVVHSF